MMQVNNRAAVVLHHLSDCLSPENDSQAATWPGFVSAADTLWRSLTCLPCLFFARSSREEGSRNKPVRRLNWRHRSVGIFVETRRADKFYTTPAETSQLFLTHGGRGGTELGALVAGVCSHHCFLTSPARCVNKNASTIPAKL